MDVAPNNPPRTRVDALVEVVGNRGDDNLAVANRGDGIRADERLVGIFPVGVLAVAQRPAVFAQVAVGHPGVVGHPVVVVRVVVVPPRLRDVVAPQVESMALDEFLWLVDSAKNHPPHRRRAAYPAESKVCLGPDNRLAEAFLRPLKDDPSKGGLLRGDPLKGGLLRGDLLRGAVSRVVVLDDWWTACDLARDGSSMACDLATDDSSKASD